MLQLISGLSHLTGIERHNGSTLSLTSVAEVSCRDNDLLISTKTAAKQKWSFKIQSLQFVGGKHWFVHRQRSNFFSGRSIKNVNVHQHAGTH